MKSCAYCKSQLKDEALFCPNCGAKWEAEENPAEEKIVLEEKHIYIHDVKPEGKKERGKNGLGVAGFILCIIGFVLSWIPVINVFALVLAALGVVLSLAGLIVGIAARKKLGLAITGLILGLITVMIILIMYYYIGTNM